jgi:hypothetical protein
MPPIIDSISKINTVAELRDALTRLLPALDANEETVYVSTFEDTGGTLRLALQQNSLTDGSVGYQILIGRNTDR